MARTPSRSNATASNVLLLDARLKEIEDLFGSLSLVELRDGHYMQLFEALIKLQKLRGELPRIVA